MNTVYGRDKTKELKEKSILKGEKTLKPQINMKKETQNTPPSYHSFLKTKG